jgi:hypothetical protein
MQAIRTRYIRPTNAKGARIKAECEGGSITVDFDYQYDSIVNHQLACKALQAKLDWPGEMVGGVFQSDYYWVFK